jgi:membrane dipeptidase
MKAGPFTPDKALASGVRLFGTAVYCQDAFNGEAAMGHLRDILDITRRCFSDEDILRELDDLARLKDDLHRWGTVLLLENADALASNPSYMKTLLDEGIRILSLTHGGRNRLADGDGVAYPVGLTREGEDVIRAVLDYGLVIDVAHLHPRCFWPVAERYSGVLVNSHTGAWERHHTPRNLDLERAHEIMNRKGVIGITFNPEMLSSEGEASTEEVFAHVDTFVQSLGPMCVGIGSDFFGFERPTRGMEDITQLPHLLELMAKHGYDASSIHAILGENWVRVYEGILSTP